MHNSTEKVRWYEKASYGFGGASCEILVTTTNAYLMLFLTSVMNISVSFVGTLFLAGQCMDAVTDLLITNFADRTRSRLGIYRPWVLFSGIPMAILFSLLFFNPSFLQDDTIRKIWVTIIYFLMVPVFQTATQCPLIAMNSLMSQDADQRLRFASARSIGESGADMLVSALAMPIVLMFGSSYLDPTGWRIMGILFGGAMVICVITSFAGTKERYSIHADSGEKPTLAQKIQLYVHNPAAIKLLLITLFANSYWCFGSTMFSYFCICNLGHEDWVASLCIVGVVCQLATTILIPRIAKRIPRNLIIALGGALLILAHLILLVTNTYVMAVVFQVVRYIGLALVICVTWGLWPDVCDYTEKIKGFSSPGTMVAFASFAFKIGMGCSSYLISILLSLGGYQTATAVQATSTLTVIRYSFCLVPIILIGITTLISLRLREVS